MTDFDILRSLAGEYAAFANSERNLAIPDNYRRLNSLNQVRPPVLIFEEPWGEFSDCEELKPLCQDNYNRELEIGLRRDLYRLKHYKSDYAIHPKYRVNIPIIDSGIGISVSEEKIGSNTGSDISGHIYADVLPDEAALSKITLPTLSINDAVLQRRLEVAGRVFDGLLGVEIAGVNLYFNSWDEIPRYHGVENCLTDLYERPEFTHELIRRFTDIQNRKTDEYERLNVLDTDPYYSHCTPACTYELPIKDRDSEKITARDCWGRAMAQIFAVVSPQMHDEFDIQYTMQLLSRCGLSYYGCCEPLDKKVDILRKIKNLRRISMTPWADPDIGAEAIGGDYVMSAKCNPAFVASSVFDPEPVIAETERILKAAKRNGTPVELILKDISTVGGNPQNLEKWSVTVNSVIDRIL